MVSGAVTNRYTEGLYRAAKAAGNVEQVERGLLTLAEAMKAHVELKAALEHPLIDAAAKTALVKGVFGETLVDTVYRFLSVLFVRDRSGYIASVAEAFHHKAEADRGRLQVQVESAQPLSEGDLARLKQGIESAAHKQVDVVTSVNPQLIAGYRVRFGNRVLDATVRAAIDQFSEHLLAAGASKEGTR